MTGHVYERVSTALVSERKFLALIGENCNRSNITESLSISIDVTQRACRRICLS